MAERCEVFCQIVIFGTFLKGWKKSLGEVMVVVEVHEETVEVGLGAFEALPEPFTCLLWLFAGDASDVAQEILTVLGEGGDVHTELGGMFGGQRSGEVAGGHDVPDFGMAFGEIRDEIHLLPAILFFAVDAGEAKTLEGIAAHEVEGSICIRREVLVGLS
jgi:hypothetical protein